MHLELLKEIGLSEGQVSVYASLLEIGNGTLNKIHEKTGIERRNIYDILNKLIERGLVSYTLERNKKTFQCTNPGRLREEVEKKEAALKELKQTLPEVKALFSLSKPEIRAEVYRGNEAMKALLIEALEYKAMYWIGGNSGVEKTNLKNWFNHWMQRRVEKKCMLYDLLDYGTYLDCMEPNKLGINKKMLYKRCELPPQLASPMVILIFGDKVAQILWSRQSFAFVMQSKESKDSFMRYFHYFWKDPW